MQSGLYPRESIPIIVVSEGKMGQDVLGVGISIRCDDSDFRDLGPNLDEAARLGVDYVEIPTLTMPLVADGRVMPEQVRKAKATIAATRELAAIAKTTSE